MMAGLEQDLLIEMLDEIIRRSVPAVAMVSKYGGKLYTLRPDEKEGQFCGVFAYKEHVQLAFSNGTALEDPDRVLKGTGKFRRHMNFLSPQGVDPVVVSRLIKAAAEYSRSLP